MPDVGRPFAIFRVAAGARIGYGHLRRATVLARALRQPSQISVRGGARVPTEWTIASGTARQVLACAPRLLVVDDPRSALSLPWVREARRCGVPVASLHDLGLGAVPSDLAVDGSLGPARRRGPARTQLSGAAYAVIDVPRRRPARVRQAPASPRILVSFGGGSHVGLLGSTLAALREAMPTARLIVPAGLGASAAGPASSVASAAVSRVEHAVANNGLAPLLGRVDLAVVGGGLTLYEAAAMGVPAVAVPVVEAQRPTVRAFVHAGTAVSVETRGGRHAVAARLAGRAIQLWEDVGRRTRMSARGRRTVDGRGPHRVAQALRRLAEDRHG